MMGLLHLTQLFMLYHILLKAGMLLREYQVGKVGFLYGVTNFL